MRFEQRRSGRQRHTLEPRQNLDVVINAPMRVHPGEIAGDRRAVVIHVGARARLDMRPDEETR